jgi:hypothetical protein
MKEAAMHIDNLSMTYKNYIRRAGKILLVEAISIT